MKRFAFQFLALIVASFALGDIPVPGNGRFEFHYAGKTVPVWYFLPEGAKADAPVLFVMHGVNRDAERYRKEWLPHAQKIGFVLVVPEFSRAEFPKDGDYSQGAVVDENNQPRPREQWAFSFIEPIFDAVKERTGNRTENYRLFGHSAGAQFAHRFLYFVPKARVTQVVAANAGWWTLPDLQVEFPFGLKGAPSVNGEALKAALQRRLTVLLGTNDTDPNDPHLSRTAGAMAQGPFRFARGNYFFEYGQRQAAVLGVTLNWKLGTAPGVGHSDGGMSPFAVEWLFGKKSDSR